MNEWIPERGDVRQGLSRGPEPREQDCVTTFSTMYIKVEEAKQGTLNDSTPHLRANSEVAKKGEAKGETQCTHNSVNSMECDTIVKLYTTTHSTDFR